MITSATCRAPPNSLEVSETLVIKSHHNVGGLNAGGIYLFHNCGETGSIRRGTPSYNTIVNNVFFYVAIRAGPSIYVASRNGKGTLTYDCPPPASSTLRGSTS